MKQSSQRRGPSGLWVAFLFAVACFSLVLAVHWTVAGFLHSRQIVVVPDLSGKTLEQALDVVSPLKLALAKEGVEFDENFPPGSVLRQAPPAGLNVREGRILRVTLSSGGQVVFVPDLLSVTLTEAQNRLRLAGLSLGAVSQVYSLQNEMGKVMEQAPAASAVAKPNAMVDLKVSKGPPPEGVALMPDFIHQPLERAQAWADEQKISPEIKREPSAVFPPGTVLRQFPPADSAVTPKTSLVFAISASTEPLPSPVSVVPLP